MIQSRDDLDLDWDAVYAAAAATGTALEMNGSPHRLDLSVERARRAVEAGCILTIDSDAHSTARARLRPLGRHARRAGRGSSRGSVLNTRSRAELLAWVAGDAGPVGRLTATIAPCNDPWRSRSRRARRDLAPLVVVIVGLARLLDGPLNWLVAVLLLAATLLGSLQVLGQLDAPETEHGVPIESLILPAVAAIGCLGAISLVPVGVADAAGAGGDRLPRRSDARPRGADPRLRPRR